MNKRVFALGALLVCALFGLAALPAVAADVAVVDTARVLTESKPGRDGEAHLQKVRDVLQQGLADLQKLYKGKEKSKEAQAALQNGHAALERQLAVERQAVLQALGQCLDAAVKQWRKANGKYEVVLARQNLLDHAPAVDMTAAVMKEMDKQKPVFPELPTVTVTPPAEAKKPEPKATPKATPKR